MNSAKPTHSFLVMNVTLGLGLMGGIGHLEAMSIHEAARAGNLARVIELVAADPAQVHEQDRETGDTPLHEACRHGHLAIVEYLLAMGAKLDIDNFYNRTPLQRACLGGHPALVRLLFEEGARGKPDYSTLLHDTCDISAYTPGHLAVAQYLLDEQHVPIDEEIITGTPLRIVCKHDHTALAKLFLKRGADVNRRDRDGKVPLHYACGNKNFELVKALLQKGAKLDMKDKQDKVPLRYACDKRTWSIVKLLISKGSPVYEQENDSLYSPPSRVLQETLYWEGLRTQESSTFFATDQENQQKKDLCEHVKTMAASKSGFLCIWLRSGLASYIAKKITNYAPNHLSKIVTSLFVHLADKYYDPNETLVLADKLKKLVPEPLWVFGFKNAPLAFRKAYQTTPRQLFNLLQEEKKCDTQFTFA